MKPDILRGRTPVNRILKRLVDVIVSVVGLIVLGPLLLVVAVFVWSDSGRPVLFRQTRIGRNFRPFQILKFRTMVSRSPGEGRELTVGDDPRITRVGRLLRRTKIDEFPQLINVLRGDMSLVGPRPEVPRFVERLRAEYEDILRVRPGITDPASLQFSHESELLSRADDPEQTYLHDVLPEKLRLSREYLDRASLVEDVKLIFRTLFRVVRVPPTGAPRAGLFRSG